MKGKELEREGNESLEGGKGPARGCRGWEGQWRRETEIKYTKYNIGAHTVLAAALSSSPTTHTGWLTTF